MIHSCITKAIVLHCINKYQSNWKIPTSSNSIYHQIEKASSQKAVPLLCDLQRTKLPMGPSGKKAGRKKRESTSIISSSPWSNPKFSTQVFPFLYIKTDKNHVSIRARNLFQIAKLYCYTYAPLLLIPIAKAPEKLGLGNRDSKFQIPWGTPEIPWSATL